jgi:MutS domain V
MNESLDNPKAESPRDAYTRRLRLNRERLEVQERWHRYLGYSKIAAGLFMAFFIVWFLHELHGIWPLFVALATFVVLAIVHEKVLTKIRDIKTVITHYEWGLARLEDRWAGMGEGGDRFLDAMHPYARDLDLFGKGSVFELLCTFRTRAGEETLARWLLEPAPPEEIRARQGAAQELQTRIGFRERLFTAGHRARLGLHPDALAGWGGLEVFSVSRWLPLLTATLAVLWVVLFIYGVLHRFYVPVVLLSICNLLINSRIMKRIAASVETVEAATTDLDLLIEIMKIIEREPFESPRLLHLQSALQIDGTTPSAALRKLDRLVRYLEQRSNKLLVWFGLDRFLLYAPQWMFRVELWRREFGPAIRGWLAAVGEMEVLAALSGYAFEHPGYAWPEFDDERPCFRAEALAHPLLPEGNAIGNDLNLCDGLQLIMLSGPNMSGKSTFVRGIGVNAVLAQCGAPVRAKRLRMSRLAVGASICVLDSLQGGISRFYSEIKRLKLISDAAEGPIPVLFLLDELLSGTNSHDRFAGTRLVVEALVQRGAIGLVTTHDLALAQIPESMNGSAANFHFEDHLENGELAFDFKLKPGVVQTSNALKLMRAIGLVAAQSVS